MFYNDLSWASPNSQILVCSRWHGCLACALHFYSVLPPTVVVWCEVLGVLTAHLLSPVMASVMLHCCCHCSLWLMLVLMLTGAVYRQS